MKRHPRGSGWPGRRTGGGAWGSCWLRPTHLAARGNRGGALLPLPPSLSPPHPTPTFITQAPHRWPQLDQLSRLVWVAGPGSWSKKWGFGAAAGAAAGPRPQLPPLTPPPLLALFHPSPPPSGCTHTSSRTSLGGGGRPSKTGEEGSGGLALHTLSRLPPPPSCHSSYGVKNSNSVTLSCGYARVGLMGVTRNHLSKDAQVRILLAANFERDDHASFFLLFLAGETLARRAVSGEREGGVRVCVV